MSTTSGSRDRGEADRFVAVFGLADDAQVVFGAEDHPEAGPDERLVVDEQDAHGHDALAVSGKVACTPNPPPTRGPASTWPPCSAARSRIPIRP